MNKQQQQQQQNVLRRYPLRSSFLAPFFQFPTLFEEEREEQWPLVDSNISLSEDGKNVFVEANLPGLKEEDVELSLDKGVLWIRGEHKQEKEDKEKKYYYKANRSYSYRIALPNDIDESSEPIAQFKNGVIQVTFKKSSVEQPKKIAIKKS